MRLSYPFFITSFFSVLSLHSFIHFFILFLPFYNHFCLHFFLKYIASASFFIVNPLSIYVIEQLLKQRFKGEIISVDSFFSKLFLKNPFSASIFIYSSSVILYLSLSNTLLFQSSNIVNFLESYCQIYIDC